MRLSKLVIYLLGIFTIIDATAARGAPFWREMYGFIFILTVMIVFINLLAKKIDKAYLKYVIAYFILAIAIGFMIFFQPIVYPVYIFGDFVVILFPILLLLLYLLRINIYTKKNINALLLLLLFAAIIAPLTANKFYGGKYDWIGRFDPPHIILFVASWVYFFQGKRPAKSMAFIISVVLLTLSFNSGQRTSVLLWLTSGILVWIYYVMVFPPIKKMMIILSSILLVGSASITATVHTSSFEIGRFDKIRQRGIEKDESLLGRINEVLDVLRATKEEDNIILFLFGHGYGATFEARYAYKKNHPNLTREGRIHNIHIGPALIFYRYGFITLILYSLLITNLTILLLQSRKYQKSLLLNKYEVIMIISFFVESVNFTMRNVSIDPIYSYILVGVFITLENKRSFIKGKRAGSKSRISN